MKISYIFLSAIFFLFAACQNDTNDNYTPDKPQTKKIKFSTRQDTAFYSMGIVIGKQMKKYGITNVDYDILLKGIKDGMTLEDNQLPVDASLARDLAGMYVNNVLAGKISNFEMQNSSFLAKNSKKDGVISLPNGIQYKILTQGKGKKPNLNDKVQVSYTGRLVDGTVFTTTAGKKSPVFIVKNAIPGWRIILPKMNEGSEWEIYLPPEYAFGNKGTPLVPPGAVVIYRIKLQKIL